jgi:hypothetical protein
MHLVLPNYVASTFLAVTIFLVSDNCFASHYLTSFGECLPDYTHPFHLAGENVPEVGLEPTAVIVRLPLRHSGMPGFCIKHP